MFYSGGKAKKQNVNRMFGDYNKKKNVKEIESENKDSHTDYSAYVDEKPTDSPRSRARARSRENVNVKPESIYDNDNDNDNGNDNDNDDDEATTAYKLLPTIKSNERWILSYCCKK
jgi:hypothetical protein